MHQIFKTFSLIFAGLACLFGTKEVQAGDQNAVINLQAIGPGVLSVGQPGPYQNGQVLELRAEPVAGARFIQWQDGLVNPVRQITVAPDLIFTAAFEDIPFNSNLVPPAPALDPETLSRNTRVEGPLPAGADLKLTLKFAGRHGFKLLGTDVLDETSLQPIDFSLTPGGPRTTASISGPGPVDIFLPWPAQTNSGFFEIQFDNGVKVPLIYFSDVTRIDPGGPVTLYGANLDGLVSVETAGQALPVAAHNDSSIQIAAPVSSGNFNLTVSIDGIQAAGILPLAVVPFDPLTDPVLVTPQANLITSDGILRLTGTNFSSDSTVKWNDRLLQVLARSPDGTELIVRLPAQEGSGTLSVLSSGTRTTSLNLNLTGMPFVAAIQPVNIFAFQAGVLPLSYTAAVSRPVNVFTHVLDATAISYTAAVLPVRIKIQ